MAANVLHNITQRGVESKFREVLKNIPTLWDKFCQTVPSDGPDVEHAWLGFVPKPREFLTQRELVSINDFTYNAENKEYELSVLFDQKTMEDDRTGTINQRIAEMAGIWGRYKDQLWAAAVVAGATTGNNSFDAVTFFNASHVIGAATPDNALASSSPTDADNPTTAEMKVILRTMMLSIQSMQDDTAEEAYNWPAMHPLILMANQDYEQSLKETLHSAIVAHSDDAAFSAGVSNPYFENMADILINPYLGSDHDYLYMAALGDPLRMPFIFQDRLPVEIRVLNDPASIVTNRGVLVACRGRWRFAYGEPRRMIRMALT